MILFGDIDFFTSDSVRNKSGQRLWLGFLSLLEAGGHVYRDGLPVVCQTHKTRVDLSSPGAFDEHVPDGGCRMMCGATLLCDKRHPCPRRYDAVLWTKKKKGYFFNVPSRAAELVSLVSAAAPFKQSLLSAVWKRVHIPQGLTC